MNRIALSALAAAAVGLLAIAGPGSAGGKDSKALLTDAQFTQLVAGDGKVLVDALATGNLDKKTGRRAATAALLIAAYGECSAHADAAAAKGQATLVYTAVKGSNVADAKKAAAGLYPKIKPPDAAPKKEPVVDFMAYMHLFSGATSGGFGGEQELNNFEESKEKFSEAQFERLGELALKVAVVGQVAPKFAPEKDEKDQTKKNWLAFANEFRTAGLALHGAAAAKDEMKTRTTLETVNKVCVKCHDVFR